MRYIYALRKKEERQNTNLKKYENEIRESLKELKDLNAAEESHIVVNGDSFEFSFQGCLSREALQGMGKLLVASGVEQSGFIRQKNKAYAFLSYDESRAEEERVLVELVDCSTVNFENEYIWEDVPQWVRFYRGLELCTTYISVGKATNIFDLRIKRTQEDTIFYLENTVFLVELRHYHLKREKYNESGDISSSDPKNSIKENICMIEHLYSAGLYQTDFVDLANIKLVDTVSDSTKESLISKLNLEIESHVGQVEQQYNADRSEEDRNTKYTFTVHNVGQALATSLSEKGKAPFFYFDYGIACGWNKFTLPVDVELPIEEKATILLSHVDEDHWCGFRLNQKALKCRWVIPQNPTKSLKKLLSSVYLGGGSISLYKADGLNIFEIKAINNCMAAGNAKSMIKPLRVPKTVHENGNALYIFAEHDGMEYKILVSGDQDYDYQDSGYLNDINLLVACHHGGKYSWSKKTIVPKPNAAENRIVYSYGQGNTHGHPSMVQDYSMSGWKTEHHTALDGDCEIDLLLVDNETLKKVIKSSNPSGMEFEI